MWETIFSIVLKLLGFAATKVKMDQKSRESFIKFVEESERLGLVSSNVRNRHRSRMAKLEAKRKAEIEKLKQQI